jgi:flagellar biosynthesis protein FlhG
MAGVDRIISVGGGKGGVGKSVVAGNLAVAMAQAGARVTLLDADLGAANQHTLFGISRPGPGLQGFLDGELQDLAAARIETMVPNLLLLPGTAGVIGAANIPAARKEKLLRHVRALDADVVIVDVGAGVSFNVLDLFDVADVRLVVMSPQLTSAQNAYAFLKAAVFRELRRLAATERKGAWIDHSEEAQEATSATPALLARLRGEDPALADRLQAGLARFGARLVGNQLFDPNDRNVFYAISRMVRDFLGIDAPVVGALRASRRLHDSVNAGRPYLVDLPGEETAEVLRQMARLLLRMPVPRTQGAAASGSVGPPPGEGLPLPVTLNRYHRAAERHPVDCEATLVAPGGIRSVRIRDVSMGGALLGMDRPPAPGIRVVLVMSALDGRPSLPCIVRHSSEEAQRAGVEFLTDPENSGRICETLLRRFPRNRPAEEAPDTGPSRDLG